MRRLAILPFVMLLVACADTVTEPVNDAPAPAFSVSGHGPVVESVAGSGSFVVTTQEGDWRTFAFTARRYADGMVAGQWERIRRPEGNAAASKSHGVVTCFTIIGNAAWVGGYATKGLYSDPPNNEIAFRLVDNGQGGDTDPDQMSLQSVDWAPGFADSYCTHTPDSPPLVDLAAGNIQVKALIDGEAPVIVGLQPPDETPLFVWNPDFGLNPFSRLCPSSDPNDCESLMFEAVDLGTGVEDGSCGVECADDDGDGNLIDVLILDSPGDAYNGKSLFTNNSGLGANMFQAAFCESGPYCDEQDDGVYTVRVLVSDKTQPVNNVAQRDYSFELDVTPPIIGFGGVTGLNASNAADVQFVLDASVVDRNGDGTAVEQATVQVTLELVNFSDGVCGNWQTDAWEFDQFMDVLVTPPPNSDPLSTAPVIVDVTSQVNTNQGDFSVTFTAQNQAANLGVGDYQYCFTITADDGAKRKDGTDDGVSTKASAGKAFTWQ